MSIHNDKKLKSVLFSLIITIYFFSFYVGVAGIPGCNMTRSICDRVDDLLRIGVYVPFVQNHLAQANYYRDPLHLDLYLKNDVFLADINNERQMVRRFCVDGWMDGCVCVHMYVCMYVCT